MEEARADPLTPNLASTQQVGYGQILRIVVIVIADRARGCSARREEFVNRTKHLRPPSKFDANRSVMVTMMEGHHATVNPVVLTTLVVAVHQSGCDDQRASAFQRTRWPTLSLWPPRTKITVHDGHLDVSGGLIGQVPQPGVHPVFHRAVPSDLDVKFILSATQGPLRDAVFLGCFVNVL